MLAPFLLIGIGGSGGVTLRTARADLERKLSDLGWTQPFPDAWQFLHFDVPITPDGFAPGLPDALPAGCYKGLVPPGVNYRVVDRLLTQSIEQIKALDATAGWRPMASQVSVPIDRGAGQYRAIGRVITVTHLSEIKRAIEEAVARLQTPDVKAQLMNLARVFGADEKTTLPPPTFLIISSLAGGSGAGAVLDVTWALRSVGVAVDKIGLLLFAPDVFNSIPENMRKGVRPNALATLSELAAQWWNERGPSETTTALYSAEGMALSQMDGRAPSMTLIGRKNANNLDYVDQNAVYIAIGEALSAWVASQTLQDHLTAYITGNSTQSSFATVPDFPSALGHQVGPFRSIGFARVSLGRNLFRDFARKYLARLSVEVILRKHLENRRGADDIRTDQQLVEEAANLAFQGFLRACGLHERGRTQNDVLDALLPPDVEQQYRQMESAILGEVVSNIGQGKDVPAIRAFIRGKVEDHRFYYVRDQEAAQLKAAAAWCRTIQDRMMQAVATSVARSGALVTAEMLARLNREELPALVAELRQEAEDEARWSSEIESAVQAELQSAGNSSLPANSPLVARAVSEAAKRINSGAEEHRRKLAIELLNDLSQNFVEPLRLALDAGRQRLADDEKPKGAVPSEISFWPTGDSVPSAFTPAPNEFLLQSPATYPATLAELLSRSVEEMPGGDAAAEVVTEIICGAARENLSAQRLIRANRRWAPAKTELRQSASQPPQRAQFEVFLRSEQLLDRATEWSKDRTRAMGRYLAQSLAEHLAPGAAEPEEVAARVARFEGQFAAAVGAAAPLAAVDNQMLTQVHKESAAPVSHVFTPIPFPTAGAARDAAVRVLTNAQIEWEKLPFEDSPADHIDVFTALTSLLHPVVFDSLMKPVASEWATAKQTAETRNAFWRWRRARPLPEFVPVAPEIRTAMVRGWFAASLLNRLSLPDSAAWSIWDPGSRGAVPFPYPLLHANTSLPYELMPAVLKSLPLAWLECSVQGDLRPIRAYACLRDLGGAGETDYELAKDLNEWLLGNDTPGSPAVEEAGANPQDRRAHALKRIKVWKGAYGKLFAETAESLDPHRAPRAYELRDDIESALDQLQGGVENTRGTERRSEWT